MFRFSFLRILGLTLLCVNVASAQQIEKRLPPAARPDSSRDVSRFGTIAGVVSDTNLVPLEGAEVSILRTNVKAHTVLKGRFQILKVPPGEYLLITRRLGFRPVSTLVQVPAGDTARLSYTLERVTQSLEAVVVTEQRQSVRMMEFESRRKLGFGEFMTRDDIEKRGSQFAPDLFRAFMTIDVSPVNAIKHGGQPEYMLMGKRGSATINGPGGGSCPMTVFVDRVPMPFPFDLNLLPSSKDLAGIEVYAGAATAPPQFASNGLGASCGVVLIWTRDR